MARTTDRTALLKQREEIEAKLRQLDDAAKEEIGRLAEKAGVLECDVDLIAGAFALVKAAIDGDATARETLLAATNRVPFRRRSPRQTAAPAAVTAAAVDPVGQAETNDVGS